MGEGNLSQLIQRKKEEKKTEKKYKEKRTKGEKHMSKCRIQSPESGSSLCNETKKS